MRMPPKSERLQPLEVRRGFNYYLWWQFNHTFFPSIADVLANFGN